jgi:hypothetical protein
MLLKTPQLLEIAGFLLKSLGQGAFLSYFCVPVCVKNLL